jgi:hypothetical protein
MSVTLSESEAQKLKNYIALYCKNEEHIDAVFQEVAGGGHKADDPFIKYMVPIIANRIAVEEAKEQIEKLQKSLELITLNNIAKEQVKIKESIAKIEEVLYRAKEARITEQKNDKIAIPFAITVMIAIIAFSIGSLGINLRPIDALNQPAHSHQSPAPTPSRR